MVIIGVILLILVAGNNEPPVVLLRSDDLAITAGGTVSLVCASFGIPEPNMTWTMQALDSNNTLTLNDERVNSYIRDVANKTIVISFLQLCPVSVTDTGVYTCTAHNGVEGPSLGLTSAAIQLTVNVEGKHSCDGQLSP